MEWLEDEIAYGLYTLCSLQKKKPHLESIFTKIDTIMFKISQKLPFNLHFHLPNPLH